MVPLHNLITNPAAPVQPRVVPRRSRVEQTLLNQLRMSALRSRSAARTDLFEACALLTLDPNAAQMAFADALMRSLKQALGQPPVFYRPGVDDMSFDESWLLALAQAHARGDRDSFSFLIASRVEPTARRNLGFLVGRIADDFSLD